MPRLVPLLLAAALALPGASQAGPFADELSKCLVRSSTPADKAVLVRWMFSMMALHPEVSQLATVQPARRKELNQQMAALLQSLLTKSCNQEARAAFQHEGQGIFEASFNVLGQTAGRELFTDPGVAAGLAELGGFVDANALREALQPKP